MNKKFLKLAQQLQKQMVQMQQELEGATVEGSAGGGVVTEERLRSTFILTSERSELYYVMYF